MFFHPFQRLVIGRDQCASGSSLNRQITERHAAFNSEGIDSQTAVFNHFAQRTARGNAPQYGQREVLGLRAGGQLAGNRDPHGAGHPVDKRLSREKMLYFRRSDAEPQSAERSVGGGVAVAANDHHARAH